MLDGHRRFKLGFHFKDGGGVEEVLLYQTKT